MERLEQLKEFMAKHDNVSFMGANVPRVLENLEKADQDGCLREFLLNKKPYISAFTFFVFNEKQQAARGKEGGLSGSARRLCSLVWCPERAVGPAGCPPPMGTPGGTR